MNFVENISNYVVENLILEGDLMFRKLIALSLLSLAMISCGGGGGGGGETPPANNPPAGGSSPATNTISGTAAGGLPVVGFVNVKGAAGNVVSSDIEVDGSYSVDVSTLTAPFILYAEGTVNNETVKYYSAAVGTGTLNITSVTDFIVRNAVAGDPDAAYGNWEATQISEAELTLAADTARAQFAQVLIALGHDVTTVDLLRTPFSANQTGLDLVLEVISFDYVGDIATITNTLTNASFEDDTSNSSDNGNTFDPATAEETQVLLDQVQITITMQIFNELYATSIPTAGAVNTFVETYITTDYLGWGANREQLTNDLIVSEPPVIGTTIGAVITGPYDVTGTDYVRGYQVSTFYNSPGEGADLDTEVIFFDGTTWRLHGNREWIEREVESRAVLDVYSNNNTSLRNGVQFWLKDQHGYSATQGVQSAIITGHGLPEAGIKLAYQTDRSFAIDNEQWNTLVEMDDATLQAFANNTEYTVSLYTQTWNVVTLSDAPLQTYTYNIPRGPILNSALDASYFPTLSAPTSHTLAAANIGGTLSVNWANATGASVNWISFYADEFEGERIELETGLLVGGNSVVFDSSAEVEELINFAPDYAGLWIASEDQYGRSFILNWQFNDFL